MTAKCTCCKAEHSNDRIGTVCRDCGRGMIEGNVSRFNEFSEEMQPTDSEVSQLGAAGFEDDSWHNNICVSFTRALLHHDRPEGFVTVWTDAIDPADRGMCGPRFLVCVYDESGSGVDDIYNGDSLDAAIAAADKYQTEYNG